MKKAKLFKNGQSQAVRLPKEFRFNGTEVYAQKQGEGVLLLPIKDPWLSLRNSLDQFTPDFMPDRNQPAQQTRKGLR